MFSFIFGGQTFFSMANISVCLSLEMRQSQDWECRNIPELSLRFTLIFKMNHGGPLSCYCRNRETLHYNKIIEENGVGRTDSQEFIILICKP